MSPLRCQPATTETPSGTQVLVVEDVGTGVTITRTRSAPWQLGDWRQRGDFVVLLEGRTGGYLLERCFVVPPEVMIGKAQLLTIGGALVPAPLPGTGGA